MTYNPRDRKVGDPSPQTEPELFTDDEIRSEIKYLMGLNKRHGFNALRTAAYLRLLKVLEDRTNPETSEPS